MRALRALTSSSTTRILPLVLTWRTAPLAVGDELLSDEVSMLPPGGHLGDQGHPGPLPHDSATVGPSENRQFRCSSHQATGKLCASRPVAAESARIARKRVARRRG